MARQRLLSRSAGVMESDETLLCHLGDGQRGGLRGVVSAGQNECLFVAAAAESAAATTTALKTWSSPCHNTLSLALCAVVD